MIDHKLSEDDALRLFPHGYEGVNVPSQRNYLKLTAQPNLHVQKPSAASNRVDTNNEDEDAYDHINADYHRYEF